MSYYLRLVFYVCFTFSACAFCADSTIQSSPRIDIHGIGTDLTIVNKPANGYMVHPSYKKDNEKKQWINAGIRKINQDIWTTFSISFTPTNDGEVEISLCGEHNKSKDMKKLNKLWVYFDEIKVTGAQISNGNFQESTTVNDKTIPKDWALDGEYIKDGKDLLQDKSVIKVWHNRRAKQTIKVKAGQEVTLTVSVLPGPVELSAE